MPYLLAAAFLLLGAVTGGAQEVRGVARGVNAVGRDPAATAEADGLEFAIGSFAKGSERDRQFRAAAVLPMGPLVLHAGHEWLETSPNLRRGTFGLALRPSSAFALGVGYRWLARQGVASAPIWDMSLLVEPSSWLSLAFGVEGLNSPSVFGARMEREAFSGIGIRPWRGADWLTLGAEAKVRLARARRVLTRPSFGLDIALREGLHLGASYAQESRELWLKLGASFGHAEISMATAGATDGGSLIEQSGAELTLRARPKESLLVSPGRTVEVPLRGDLRDEMGFLRAKEPIARLLLRLASLAEDDSVARVVLVVGDLALGAADIDDLRLAIARLRLAGKDVTAELESGSQAAYLVAAAANRVRLDPAVSLTLNGNAATLLYFADTFAKVGISFEAIGVGRYKTAPDALTRARPREEELEVTRELLAARTRVLRAALEVDRALPKDRVAEVLEEGIFTGARALALGLVDELSQPRDVRLLPRERKGGEALPVESPRKAWGLAPAIAVIPVVGEISAGGARSLWARESVSAARIVAALDQARDDPELRAVVLRIDSPGGEVYASEKIWRAARLCAQEKPLVVSMGNVAASGGYYIAAPAHAIFASPTTITGSIGIYLLKPKIEGLLALLGVHAEIVKDGPHADIFSVVSSLTERQRELVQTQLDARYEDFIDRVAHGRGLTKARVQKLAEGRVYSGQRAFELGLIDELGDLTAAIARARKLADLPAALEVEVRVLAVPGAIERITGMTGGAAGPEIALRARLDELRALAVRPMARLPFDIMEEP